MPTCDPAQLRNTISILQTIQAIVPSELQCAPLTVITAILNALCDEVGTTASLDEAIHSLEDRPLSIHAQKEQCAFCQH